MPDGVRQLLTCNDDSSLVTAPAVSALSCVLLTLRGGLLTARALPHFHFHYLFVVPCL